MLSVNNRCLAELKSDEYYDKYISSSKMLNNINEINNYSSINTERFTIGCIGKSIFGATVLLFSYDPSNSYLFRDKGLNITIGDLLNNRKRYLESLQNPTEVQIKKLDFINRLLPTADTKILSTEVYKVLNHTSVFADDLDEYFLYLIAQKILNIFPDNYRNFLMMTGIQYLSLSDNQERIEGKYSNMGFMYMIGVMSLMTDKADFYQEVNNRIFKPLQLEGNFVRADSLSPDTFKKMFHNQNYHEKVFGKRFKLDIYDFQYNEMDTLNAGLISDLNSVIIVGKEIARMYFGFENKLSNNPNIPFDYFEKYKVYYGKDEKNKERYYSLGSIFYILNNEVAIKMSGRVFGRITVIDFFRERLINAKPSKNNSNLYNKDDYNSVIDIRATLTFDNNFLKELFFYEQEVNLLYNPFRNILAKSIYDAFWDGRNIDTEKIEWYVNYEPKKLIKQLSENIDKNMNKLKITNGERERLKKESKEYFKAFKKALNVSD